MLPRYCISVDIALNVELMLYSNVMGQQLHFQEHLHNVAVEHNQAAENGKQRSTSQLKTANENLGFNPMYRFCTPFYFGMKKHSIPAF